MAYIAKRPCKFAGHNFLIGEVIPEELVLKSRVPQLVKTKVIEVVNGVESPISENEMAESVETEEVEENEESVETEDVEEVEESVEPETVSEPAKRGRKKKSE